MSEKQKARPVGTCSALSGFVQGKALPGRDVVGGVFFVP